MRLLQVRRPWATEITPQDTEPASVRNPARALSVPFLAGAGLLALISIYFTVFQTEYNMYTYNLCLLAVLVKIPFWAKELAFGQRGGGNLRVLRYVAVGRLARAVI